MATALSVAFTPTPVPIGYSLIVEATPQMSAGKRFVPRSAYRVVQVVAAAGVSPANILTSYVALFGALAVGSRIFFRITPVIQSTMQKGVPIETSVVVA